MKTYEYKTKVVNVDLRGGEWFVPAALPAFDAVLSTEGAEGWRYVAVLHQEKATASPGNLLAMLFERETTRVSRQRTKGVDPRA